MNIDKLQLYHSLLDSISEYSLKYYLNYDLEKNIYKQVFESTPEKYSISKADLFKEYNRSNYDKYLYIINKNYTIENDYKKEAIDILFNLFSLLSLTNETPMISAIIDCIYYKLIERIPSSINQAMQSQKLEMSDVSFLKVATIVKDFDKALELPYGLKNSLIKLNIDTAFDIMNVANIYYDICNNRFVGKHVLSESIKLLSLPHGVVREDVNEKLQIERSTANSVVLNVICAGNEALNRIGGDDELFTETELMDFCSFLSSTPMFGSSTDTGRKIYELINGLYIRHENRIDFDKPVYFHSRSRNRDAAPFPFDEMLRAPYGLPGAGRFNHVGRSSFYFSDTQRGAESEVKKHLKRNEILQTATIYPTRSADLLDLSGTLKRGKKFLKYLRYQVPENNKNNMPKEYLIPCFVADCSKQVGFDGIKYYGAKDYMNYVCWYDGFFNYNGMCE